MTGKRCAKCIFWTEMCANCDNGICNRYPQVVEKNYMESCGEWEPREGYLIESNLLDAAHKMLTSNDPKDTRDFSDSLSNLVISISRIDQFIRGNPDIEIRFSKDPSIGSQVFLEAYIVIQQQHMHKCIYGAAALSFEELLLRISSRIAEMKKDQ